ncbi:MAG: transglycosylase SLT domain-containing protein [Rhodocyclaceae bacterium]|nr:transglycosylase SLT domain-containing protein [Rhodocyclaceae bacterium]
MFATTLFHPVMSRLTATALALIQTLLMVSGLIMIVGLFGLHQGNSGFVEGFKSLLPKHLFQAEGAVELPPTPEVIVAEKVETLSPTMRGALNYVSKRYRVSTDALQPIFATAQEAGRELRLDPLLIIAVIGIESGFNPLSQSVVGAQGLMQVMPRFHQDKLPSDAGELPFFDPLTNVQVGAKVLKESIRRNGGLEPGLQQFAGAINDPERRYANKVLAEMQRLEQASQRLRSTNLG